MSKWIMEEIIDYGVCIIALCCILYIKYLIDERNSNRKR